MPRATSIATVATKKPSTAKPAPRPAKPKMNIALLRRVRARILAKPETYNQNCFCNTSFCIAGHAILAGGSPAEIRQFKRLAKQAHTHDLDALTDVEAFVAPTAEKLLRLSAKQAQRLFTSSFPGRLDPEASHAKYVECSPIRYAQVGAKRIDLFISSKGRK